MVALASHTSPPGAIAPILADPRVEVGLSTKTLLAVAGGALLVTAHALNIRACRRADDCCAPPALAEGG